MRLHDRNHLTALLAAVALLAGASCSDDRGITEVPRQMTPPGSNATIWDGSQVGGNPNVFFLPPLVPNPNGVAPTYGVNPFQPGLPVQFEIACLTAPAGGSCTGRGLTRTNGTMDQSNQHYQYNWDTKAPGFDPGYVFRINVWIGGSIVNNVWSGGTNVAFADVILIPNANPKNKNTSDDIPLPDGRTMPIKVHVQTGWACRNQTTCVTQVVGNTPPAGQNFTKVITNDGEDLAAFPANWFDPAAVGSDNVLVTIEDVTPNFPSCSTLGGKTQLTTMLSRNHCVRVTTDPEVQNVTNNVLIATCIDSPGDARQLILKYDTNEQPIFLRNVNVSAQTGFVCPENRIGMSRSTNPFVRYASNTLTRVGGALKTLFGPKTAYAIDQGVGGSLDVGGGFSVFNLGVDASMEMVSGDNQSGPQGSTLAARMVVRVFSLHTSETDSRSPVVGQQLTCTASGGGGFLVGNNLVPSVLATDNLDGTYSCQNLTLSSTPGTNRVVVTSATLDPAINIEVVPTPDDQSTSCFSFDEGGTGPGLPNSCRQYAGSVTFTATSIGDVIGLLRLDRRSRPLGRFGERPQLAAEQTQGGI